MRPVTDPDRIRKVLTHPSIWPHIGADGGPSIADWQPPMGEGLYYLMPPCNGACFIAHAHTSARWEVHIAVLPPHRHESLGMALQFVEWMRCNTSALVLTGFIPRGNYRARALARACGFVELGTIPKAIVREGIALDESLYVLELT